MSKRLNERSKKNNWKDSWAKKSEFDCADEPRNSCLGHEGLRHPRVALQLPIQLTLDI